MNAVKCLNCNDIIESTHRHDFVSCKCGSVSVDGGDAYKRRVYDAGADFIELDEVGTSAGLVEAYQVLFDETAKYPDIGSNLTYTVLGLAGEAGEIAGKLSKEFRDQTELLEGEDGLKELGDVLWFVVAAAFELGYTFEDVIRCNMEKLTDREARGVIGGSGDNR